LSSLLLFSPVAKRQGVPLPPAATLAGQVFDQKWLWGRGIFRPGGTTGIRPAAESC